MQDMTRSLKKATTHKCGVYSWAIALDRKDANEKDLETLCTLHLEEGKKRMPRHQHRMELLKAGN